jgi:hypothetical protein
MPPGRVEPAVRRSEKKLRRPRCHQIADDLHEEGTPLAATRLRFD